jgi:hypothetical protein
MYLFSFAKNTPFFTLIVQRVFSFLLLHSVFIFCLDFSSDLVLSLHQGVFFTSGPCWFSSKELFQKCSNSVGKEKMFHAKKWYKKELV